jgi:hypothetical protein
MIGKRHFMSTMTKKHNDFTSNKKKRQTERALLNKSLNKIFRK